MNEVGILKNVKYSWKDVWRKSFDYFIILGKSEATKYNEFLWREEQSRGNILVGIGCWIQEILFVLVVVFSAIKYVKVCKNVWEKFWLTLTYKHGKNL